VLENDKMNRGVGQVGEVNVEMKNLMNGQGWKRLRTLRFDSRFDDLLLSRLIELDVFETKN
jgi:hypothetical protein